MAWAAEKLEYDGQATSVVPFTRASNNILYRSIKFTHKCVHYKTRETMFSQCTIRHERRDLNAINVREHDIIAKIVDKQTLITCTNDNDGPFKRTRCTLPYIRPVRKGVNGGRRTV